jgi:hypothetical protein
LLTDRSGNFDHRTRIHFGPHADSHILIQRDQESNQPIHREPFEPTVQESRDLRLADPEYFGCLYLRQPTLADNDRYTVHEISLCLKEICIGKAEISKNITAALGHTHQVAPLLSSRFRCFVFRLCEPVAPPYQIDLALRRFDSLSRFLLECMKDYSIKVHICDCNQSRWRLR